MTNQYSRFAIGNAGFDVEVEIPSSVRLMQFLTGIFALW
jgi:hypothetical protein